MIALLEAQRAGLYARRHWLPNIVAGVIVGVVALPLAMAFAIASGARPEQGIYTAIIGGGPVSVLLQTLHEVIDKLRGRGVRVLLCEANARVLTKLRNARVLDALGAGEYCATLGGALARVLEAGCPTPPPQP